MRGTQDCIYPELHNLFKVPRDGNVVKIFHNMEIDCAHDLAFLQTKPDRFLS